MKQRYLLSLLLLTPSLAHADPLNNGALGVLGFIAMLALGFVGLTLLLVVLASRRPASRELQVAQVLLLALFIYFSLTKYRAIISLLGTGVEAGLPAVIPFALLLNGLAQAKRTQLAGVCRAWLGLAVAGSTGLLWVGVDVFRLDELWQPDLQNAVLRTLWTLAMALPIQVIGWIAVLGLLRRYPAPAATLWHPWWATPTAAAGIAVVYHLLNILHLLGLPYMVNLDWDALGPSVLLTASVCWLAGVITLRFVRPPVQLSNAAVS
jgi:hypothetical protein